MISPAEVRRYRAAAEWEAHKAAIAADYPVWLRAIGRIVACDYVLSDEEDMAPAGERIPFPGVPDVSDTD